MRMIHTLRGAVAMGCATVLASTPLLLPAGAQPASTEKAIGADRASSAAMPHIKAKAGKVGVRLRGHRGLRAGRVRMSVKGLGTVEVVRFARGYDMEAFTKDVNKFGAKGDVKALKRALANTTILGGFSPGHSGSIVLPRAGTYSVFALGRRGVIGGPSFRVGPPQKRSMPDVDGRIIAKRGLSWGGSAHLPRHGTFLFKNKRNAGVPHFVVLQEVAEGTTADEVLEFLQSEEQGPPPSWLRAGTLETGSLSPGRSMTVNYHLPAGQYAVLCFFPDPKMGGMPHAMMGMIRMIHLG